MHLHFEPTPPWLDAQNVALWCIKESGRRGRDVLENMLASSYLKNSEVEVSQK